MKRSDVLGLILLELSTMRRNDEMSMNILDKLEEAGMLPPLVNVIAMEESEVDKRFSYVHHLCIPLRYEHNCLSLEE